MDKAKLSSEIEIDILNVGENEEVRQINIRKSSLQSFMLSRGAIKLLRNKSDEVLEKNYGLNRINGHGIYVFINEGKKLEVYIGKSINCITRLNTHINSSRIFDKAIIFVSSNIVQLNLHEIELLEKWLIRKFNKIENNKWSFENRNTNTNSIDNFEFKYKERIEQYYNEINSYLDIINYNFFKEQLKNNYIEDDDSNIIDINVIDKEDILTCEFKVDNKNIIDAKALYRGDDIIRVLAESTFENINIANIKQGYYENIKQELISSGVLKLNKDILTFNSDYDFTEEEVRVIIFAAAESGQVCWKSASGEEWSLSETVADKIKNSNSEDALYCRLPSENIEAKGFYISNKEFKVLKSSEARIEVTNSFKTYTKLRVKLIKDGILEKNAEDDKYIFTKNYVFDSPSAAGSIIKGRETNGRLDWINSAGVNLATLSEKSLNESSEVILKQNQNIIDNTVTDNKISKINVNINKSIDNINKSNVNFLETLLYCRMPSENIEARGVYSNSKKFEVLKGSEARVNVLNSFRENKFREELIKEGILKLDSNGVKYIFTQNYVFNSPSLASNIILGIRTRGNEYWRDKHQQTLGKLLAKNIIKS